MAYKTEDLLKEALEILNEDNSIIFIEEIICFMTCGKKTFYEHKLHESHELKNALKENRLRIKKNLRTKWYKSENPTLQLALYKLTGTNIERKKLSQTYQDITTKGKKIKTNNFDNMTFEQLYELKYGEKPQL